MRSLLAGAVLALTLAGCAQVAEPPPPTEAELDAYIQQEQAAQWFYTAGTGWQQPVVESRLVSWSDYTRNDSCGTREQQSMAAVDFNALSEEENLQVFEEFQGAMFACQMELILYPDEVGYYTPAQLGFIYDYYRDWLVPCLQMQGLEVTYAPTRTEFAAAAGFLSWDPYTQLGADLPPSREDDITTRCPALPAADFLEAR